MSPPKPLHYALATTLSVALMALEDGALPASTIASGARAGLESHRRQLTAALAPCGPQVARAVYASLAGMAARAPDEDAETRRAIADAGDCRHGSDCLPSRSLKPRRPIGAATSATASGGRRRAS